MRDLIAFVLAASVLPCIFLAMTGTPSALVAWVAAWLTLTLTAPTKRTTP